MRDAFVAIDAGFAFFDGDGVSFAGALFLNGEIHVLEVAAFAVVGFLHAAPFILGQL